MKKTNSLFHRTLRMECGPLQIPLLLVDFRQGLVDMPETRIDSHGGLHRFFHPPLIARRSFALRPEEPRGSIAPQLPKLLQQRNAFQITTLPVILIRQNEE